MGLIVVFLFWFSFAEDISVDSLEDKYGLKGSSIDFNIIDTNQSMVKWRRTDISTSQLIADSTKGVAPFYKKKVEMNSDSKSLKIKNLQKNDSGTYTALTEWEDKTLAEVRLTVENAVSKPTILNHDFNSSTGGCQSSVNCSADGSWATYDCDQSICTQTHVSLTSINITVTTLDSRDVQCLANNHVSTNKSTITIMCQEKQTDFHSPPRYVFWIVITLCVCVGLSLFLVLMIVLIKKLKSSKVFPQSCFTGVDGPADEQDPKTIYSTVQKPNSFQTPPGNNADNSIEATIYDTPSKHPKAHHVNSVEVNQEQQRPQEDRTVKVRATVHQAAGPDSEQINTIYCKLGEI
ncbi:SLAM family member 5 [Triplophysa dalaica]|uniref:SLAM family member 5 n=1 Tax=Triplophysa dalaica TaxID=1582913 RepID=UPI0024DFC561|nr:SLAM family member 5 [Triplophysa dalaica]XP_056588283.1 SLAM family member 5 [Triplophysa dalaica]